MDTNEAAKAKNSKITQFVERNSLHDVHQTTVCGLTVTTRLGSGSRMYFIFVTERILQMIQAAGYRALHEEINSDHVMLWADFDLFGGGQARPSSPQAREFSFDNLQVVWEKFLIELQEYTCIKIYFRESTDSR